MLRWIDKWTLEQIKTAAGWCLRGDIGRICLNLSLFINQKIKYAPYEEVMKEVAKAIDDANYPDTLVDTLAVCTTLKQVKTALNESLNPYNDNEVSAAVLEDILARAKKQTERIDSWVDK